MPITQPGLARFEPNHPISSVRFPSGFEMDLALMKTIFESMWKTPSPYTPRNDYWLIGALQVYLMIA